MLLVKGMLSAQLSANQQLCFASGEPPSPGKGLRDAWGLWGWEGKVRQEEQLVARFL